MKAILEIVERLNAAWAAGEFDQLLGVLDPGVVLVAFGPGGAHLWRSLVSGEEQEVGPGRAQEA